MKRILTNSVRYYSRQLDINMSKARTIGQELYKKRVEERARDKSNVILNNADISILGCDSQDYFPSLLVNSEGNSYLFNCHEGTQRFCYSNKVKIRDIEHVFITDPSNWKHAAGIYGLSLTLQDVGMVELNVHSSDNFNGFFDNTAKFMTYNTGMKCSVSDRTTERLFQDKGLTVRTIIIESKIEKAIDSHKRVKLNKTNYLLAYFCKLPDMPGPLDPKKCRELKVPVGPLLAKLKSGKDVSLEDGRIVKSSDVCGAKSEGLSFLVVDCPTKEHINNLISCDELETIKSLRKINNHEQVDLVIHIGPHHVTSDCAYKNWLKGFSQNCRHLLISNPNSDSINFEDCFRLQYLMRKLDNEIFPELYLTKNRIDRIDRELDKNQNGEDSSKLLMEDKFGDENVLWKKVELNDIDQMIEVNSLDKFFIRPNSFMELVDSRLPINTFYQEAEENVNFESRLKELRKLQSTLPKPKDHEPEIVFLGTGSAMPAKLRNVSFILVNFHDKKFSAILDCGEDSYGQLYRHYGPNKIIEIFRQLKLIYISHHHADHHIGLITLLNERKKYSDEQIIILAPPSIKTLLDYHNESFVDLSHTYELYSTKDLKTKPTEDINELKDSKIDEYKLDLYDKLNGFLYDITIVPVHHCLDSTAVVMKFVIGHDDMETFTISYSGDARPSEDFVIAGKGSDLLIHEATFDHRSEDDAIKKKHCTSKEAINVAKKMQAKFVILTHFSQRLAKIPYFTPDFDDRVGFAFDNLALRCPTQLTRLPIMKPILSTVFERALTDLDVKFLRQEAKDKIFSKILKSHPK